MSFEVSLKEAVIRGGYTAPTCRLCHIEYRGQFSHNLVHWDFNPTPDIADNLDSPPGASRRLGRHRQPSDQTLQGADVPQSRRLHPQRELVAAAA